MRKLLDFAYCAMWVVILSVIMTGILLCLRGN
jgi:hypothetical protein